MSSLLRSTKFVRYFTGAARTLILNSAKTAETNSLLNPKALCSANNALFRDYATSKKTENLEPLLQKLDAEVKRFGRITKRDIDEVFDEIRSKNDITSSQSLLVIRCCGELVPEELPEQRTLLVQKIWNVLTERGIPMDISHYNALLRVYIENEHPFSPALFLEELEKKGLEPNRVTYQRLMWRYCQEGDVEGATKVLERMRELNMPVSEPVLNALVMGHAFHGDTEGAKAVLETMAGAGLQPTNRTYMLLACGYAKKGDIENIENVFKTATEKDVYMTNKDVLDVIEHLAVGGHDDQVEKLFPHLLKGIGYNQDVCNLVLRLINKGHENTAKKIMKTMPKSPNAEETIFKGAFFVKQLLKMNKTPEAIIKTCRELKDEDIVPNALYIATEGALGQGNTELALELFQELKKEGYEIRQHYYWPLLAHKGKEGDEEGLIQILRKMSSEGLQPTGEALRDFVIPYMINKDNPQNIITKLQIANVPVILSARNLMIELLESAQMGKAAEVALVYRPRGQYSLIARSLLNGFSKTKDINSFVTILHVTSSQPNITQHEQDSTPDEAQNDSNDIHEIGRLVKSAIKMMKPEITEQLLVELNSKGLKINAESAEAIQQYLGNYMTTKISELLSQLTSGDMELAPLETLRKGLVLQTSSYLEQLLNKIQSKGGNNVKRIQKQLLSAYIKENKVDKMDEYLNSLKSTDFEITTATSVQLYEFYCNNDKIDKALEIKAELQAKDPEFVLNKYKSILMAYALVRANRFEEAIQYLNENKTEHEGKDNSGFMTNSKCWQILNMLAEQKDVAKVKEMTKVLIDNNYALATNVILGPSIKVNLLNDDLENALKEFEFCCNQYRSTPWKGELMKALIMKEDATKLQWVADLSTQIHGEVNILHDLVLAFVECGRLRQARRILETPGLHTRQRRLEDACQRYVEEGKSEYLEGLLEATKELSHIDRSNIFYHLLVTYCNSNETDKALGLWTILQEEGEIPSDEFLIYLGQHLKAKKRPVPFVIPQTTKPLQVNTPKPVQQTYSKPKDKSGITKTSISTTIEELVQNGNSNQAMDLTIKAIKDGDIPKANVMKFLLKTLANEGNVEKIQVFGELLNDNMKRNVTYNDKLTLAIFVKGSGAAHVDDVFQRVQNATSNEELEEALKRFPRSNALASIINNEELTNKCRKIAELAASKGQTTPANLLWMEYVLAGKNQEAETLWQSCLANADIIIFRRLLQESHIRNAPELVETLLTSLQSNKNISMGSVGNAYSRLINIYLMNDKKDDASAVFDRAVKYGVTKDDFNKNTLKRLEEALPGKKLDI